VNQYLYDADNHICAVSTYLGYGLYRMVEYVYDAEGHRVAKGTLTSFSCDIDHNGYQQTSVYVLGLNGEQVTEMDGSGNWVHTNIYAGGTLLGK